MAFKISSVSEIKSIASDFGNINDEISAESKKLLGNMAIVLELIGTTYTTVPLRDFQDSLDTVKNETIDLIDKIINFINNQTKDYSTTEQELIDFIKKAQQELDSMEVN